MSVPAHTEVTPTGLMKEAREVLRIPVVSFAHLCGVPNHRIAEIEALQSTWRPDELAAAKPKVLACIEKHRADLQSMADAISATL